MKIPKNIYLFAVLIILSSCSTMKKDQTIDHSFLYESIEYEEVSIPLVLHGDGYNFNRLWYNDFSNEDESWGRGDWIFDTNKCEFSPDMVVVKDGLLRIGIRDVKDQEHSRKKYWGGEYFKDIDPVKYGRFAVRMKPNVPKGVVASFFLAHYDFKPDYSALNEGNEIDIEFCGTSKEVELAIHYVDRDGVQQHSEVPVIDLGLDASNKFHLWEIEVMPEHIKYYLDGKIIHEVNDKVITEEIEFPMTTRMNYWISNSKEWVGEFNDRMLPLVTYYDYVAFYEWQEE